MVKLWWLSFDSCWLLLVVDVVIVIDVVAVVDVVGVVVDADGYWFWCWFWSCCIYDYGVCICVCGCVCHCCLCYWKYLEFVFFMSQWTNEWTKNPVVWSKTNHGYVLETTLAVCLIGLFRSVLILLFQLFQCFTYFLKSTFWLWVRFFFDGHATSKQTFDTKR